MDIGVIFPQTEVGGDRGAVRARAGRRTSATATSPVYDDVLGADTSVHGDLGGPYTIDDTFREPLTMFAYLAGCTDLAFATSILIGPQRQTALLAKQAAEVDLLCGGRFRLGLGIGWNKVEYDAVGVPFEKRGAILEEQIAVLRVLWTEKSVTVHGRFHDIESAGLAPLPVQRPIPIWIGAYAPAARRRVGRVADGWFPQASSGRWPEKALDTIREGATEAGRDMSHFQFRGPRGVRHPRPRHDGRARPALARGRSEPSVDQHDARGTAGRRCPHRRARRDGAGAAAPLMPCTRRATMRHAGRAGRAHSWTPAPTSRSVRSPGERAVSATGFGGPPTHIAMLRRLAVEREAWIDEAEFEDATAATNLLPGPASTQLAVFCAWRLRGLPGRRWVAPASSVPGWRSSSGWPCCRGLECGDPPGWRAPCSGPVPRRRPSRSTRRSG